MTHLALAGTQQRFLNNENRAKDRGAGHESHMSKFRTPPDAEKLATQAGPVPVGRNYLQGIALCVEAIAEPGGQESAIRENPCLSRIPRVSR